MGFFDDVDSIVINNKEVQSIISSDGGVIYEKPTGYELVLTSDKSIIQTGESATLSATLTNNSVPMAGETIFFYDSNNPPISYNTKVAHQIGKNLGASFKLYYYPADHEDVTCIVLQNSDTSLTIRWYQQGYVMVSVGGHTPTTAFTTHSFIKLENGILSDGDGHTYDISNYDNDFNLGFMDNTGTVYVEDDLIGVGVTDSNGVASVSYVGKGVGDIDVQADYNSIISSEIYLLEDCIYAHSMTTDDGHWSPLRTDGGTRFTEDGFRLGNANWTDVYFDTELPKPCSIEFNVPDYDCSSQPVPLGYLWNSTKTNRLIQGLLNNFAGVNKISLEEYPNDSYMTYTLPKGSLVRFEIKEDIIELYVNNNLIKSKSYSMPSSWVYGLVCAGSRYIYVKDMKIKPL